MTTQDQITDLQAANTRLLEENRALRAHNKALEGLVEQVKGGGVEYQIDTRRADVTKFLGLVGDEIGTSPHIPSTKRLKRLFVVAMEKPLETLLAAGASPILCFELMAMTRVAIDTIDASHANLVKLVGGCIDSQFVFEDVLVASGVDGKPFWDEIAQKNFEKAAGPRDPVTNEQLKPPGWTPPDIEGLLRKQGWTP